MTDIAEICKVPPDLVLMPNERFLTVIGVYYNPNDGGRSFAVTTFGRLFDRDKGLIGAPRFDLNEEHVELIERIGNKIMETLGRFEDATDNTTLMLDFIAALK